MLLMGWGRGVGDVNVPCTSYMMHCYAAEISGIVVIVLWRSAGTTAAAGLGHRSSASSEGR